MPIAFNGLRSAFFYAKMFFGGALGFTAYFGKPAEKEAEKKSEKGAAVLMKEQTQKNRYYESAADADKYLLISDFGDGDMALTDVAHFHDSYEIVFVSCGECGVHVNTEERVIKAGEIAFIDSFAPHFYFDADSARGKVTVVGKNLLVDFNNGLTFEPFLENNGCAEKVIVFLNSICDVTNENATLKAGAANVILGLMRASYPLKKRSGEKTTKTFVEILRYIDEHYREDINLEALAAKFGYTPNYFSVLFNKFTHMHLREYLNRRRIMEAVKIKAEHPEQSLAGVAADVGFISEKTFYRAYKKYNGNGKE